MTQSQQEDVTQAGNRKDSSAWMKVYEYLKEEITKGTYAPGERLNEKEISAIVNVSRTPTREALRILENEGYVTNTAKRGAVVKKYSLEELDAIHRMLGRLEGLAVEMAARRLSKDDLAKLQNINNRLKSLASKRNYGEYFGLAFEFHLFFPRASGSQELLETISQLRKKIFRFHYGHLARAHDSAQYLEYHQDIIDAISGKTKKRPEKIMETHIEQARKAMWDYYKMLRF